MAAFSPDTDNDTGAVVLDGETLEPEHLLRLHRRGTTVVVPPDARARIEASRAAVDAVLDGEERVYGINTGFGNFADRPIGREDLEALQHNLIRSHSAGTGEPLSPERTRRLLALRINVLAKGRSGIRWETVEKLVEACNKWCLSKVPCQGTLGASGDLAPLAHLALGLTGEGDMWDEAAGEWARASDILQKNGLEPLQLEAKEGLALINGTQMITSLGAEALLRAERLAVVADIVASLSLEALRGTVVAMDPDIHRARPHVGQGVSAARFRALLNSNAYPSQVCAAHSNCGKVQDSYTLRCAPQVHGVVTDTCMFVRRIIATEMNSATDNPMVFADRTDAHVHTQKINKGNNFKIVSGGNFHGEYPGKALDFLGIAVAELAAISERRIERLCNDSLSELPAFLVKNGGLNSGFMIAHCTAAALVSENKVLCHPSTADTIPTSAAKEDHVSMGGFAARKALDIVQNVEHVLAVEYLAACQALDFLDEDTTAPLEAVKALLRRRVSFMENDRFMQPDIEEAARIVRSAELLQTLEPFREGMNKGEAGVAENFDVTYLGHPE
jgi:histidine ammonia-lyase